MFRNFLQSTFTFVFVNFEKILHIALVLQLLTFNKQMAAVPVA